ncbi:MAG: prepilin-type N-terminal cleavage/methylation domain-containing protein [Aestuariibacter sp.]
MKKINNNKGFTLIELIIVIIILGILAVTAAPKFMDVSSDAQRATMQGMEGALKAAAQLIRAKAKIAGIDGQEYTSTNTPTITVEGNVIEVDLGFPAPTSPNVLDILDVDSGDWVTFDDNAADDAATEARVWPSGKEGDASDGDLTGTTAQDCYVSYSYDSSVSNARPVITVVSSEC